jgi:anti-sigma-K factor RskA
MKKLIGQVYDKVEVPSDYKMELLDRLLVTRGDMAVIQGESLWGRPSFWALLAATAILVVIIYGLWLPASITL